MAENISSEQNTSIITTLATALQSPKVTQSPLVKSQVEQALEQIIEGTSPELQQFSPENIQQKLKTPIKAKTPSKKQQIQEGGQIQITEEQLKNDIANIQNSRIEQIKEQPLPLTKTEQICKQTINYDTVIDRLLNTSCIDPKHCQAIYQQYDSDYTVTLAERCPYCVKRHQNEIQILKILQDIFKDDLITSFTSFNFNLIDDSKDNNNQTEQNDQQNKQKDIISEWSSKQQLQQFITQRRYEIVQEFGCQTNEHSESIMQMAFNQDFQQIQKQRDKDQQILNKYYKLNKQKGKAIYTNILITMIFGYVFNIPTYLSLPVIQKLYNESCCGNSNVEDNNLNNSDDKAEQSIIDDIKNFRQIKLNFYQVTNFYWKYIENQSSQQRFDNCLKYLQGDRELMDVIQEIIQYIKYFNPGLDFLRDSQEYLNLYNQFVITRIKFLTNTYLNQKLTIRKLQRINWMKTMFQISQCQNVNDEPQIFSYTAFYVCYCLFYQLDLNKCNYLTREQLTLYGLDLSLQGKQQFNQIVLDRFFDMFQQDGKISFGSFSILIFITVDKKPWQAVQLLFELCDVDGDGILSRQDLKQLYEEMDRIKNQNNFIVQSSPFEIYFNQLQEIAGFKDFTLKNITQTRLQSVFFNFITSLQKLIEFQVKSNSFINEVSFNDWASMMYEFMDADDDADVDELISSGVDVGNGIINSQEGFNIQVGETDIGDLDSGALIGL